MFTGLIQEVARVERTVPSEGILRLTLLAPQISGQVQVGDSVAVNGCCLTVVERNSTLISFEAVPETLSRTTLGSLTPGQVVNLELPLKFGEGLGGHYVQGHVDGTAQVISLLPEGEGKRLKVRLPPALVRYVVEKGSIALDGISLTVAAIQGDVMETALIPHTLVHTNLGEKKPGDRLHVEADMLAKHLEKLAAGYLASGVKNEN
jgi:riboflavin synthase